VHYRGGLKEFQSGLALLWSSDPLERAVGADVLGQLGWQDRAFLEESVDALLGALRDPDQSVVESSIIALGHRASSRAIDAILPFVDHPSSDLRYASVHGLMPHETPIVIDAFVKLSRDTDRDVRDWATFTLASQFASDSSTLKAALRERVEDPDPEVRGEAIVGLARRRDSGVAATILRELRGEFHGDWAVQAAGLLGDPQFLPALRSLAVVLRGKDAVYFAGTVESAIAACEGRRIAESCEPAPKVDEVPRGIGVQP
jgi:HEAT repeat protein